MGNIRVSEAGEIVFPFCFTRDLGAIRKRAFRINIYRLRERVFPTVNYP